MAGEDCLSSGTSSRLHLCLWDSAGVEELLVLLLQFDEFCLVLLHLLLIVCLLPNFLVQLLLKRMCLLLKSLLQLMDLPLLYSMLILQLIKLL